ncbi:SHOCT domain-containing protein [Actinacidiphila acidipaludis]|uniref:SHOCT domain-containing protein n=1 Tax=Actinacidiphila acidipaludis TaxID=2873382 RepID=A0ABS7PZF1_9ACTN|nr:SHOCT domain-containing protein [Streptomyces acidipaludis]MBY8876262.1 SHOCT domain-containing protein [Streptomyces acidipaludis]
MNGAVNLAYSYPVLGTFLTVLWIFLWIVWLIVLFRVIVDIFRDDTLGGGAKTGWMAFVILLPFLGVLVYVAARGRGMGAREAHRAHAQQKDLDDYIRRTAAGDGHGGTPTDELARLAEIHDKGGLSDAEFERAKEKVLH